MPSEYYNDDMDMIPTIRMYGRHPYHYGYGRRRYPYYPGYYHHRPYYYRPRYGFGFPFPYGYGYGYGFEPFMYY